VVIGDVMEPWEIQEAWEKVKAKVADANLYGFKVVEHESVGSMAKGFALVKDYKI